MKSCLQSKSLWLLIVVLWLAAACTEAPAAPAVAPATTAPSPALAAPTATPALPEQDNEIASYQPAQVVRVVDGDTIEVEIDGNEYTVRYIGIDTPETVHPTRGVEPFGPEASARNKQLVEGKTVRLEKDVSETDRFGRLLRYVYVDGVMVNATLISEGLAQVSTFPPDVKHTDMFLELQEQARNQGVGMWSDVEPTATPTIEPQQEPTGECDPSYPGVCIPPPPPDLNCGDITYRSFEVLPPDPHNFDGNKDGLACEGSDTQPVSATPTQSSSGNGGNGGSSEIAPTATPTAIPTETPTATSTPVPIATPTATVTPTAEPQQEPTGECDPSYPGVCIPPAPPDLDCGDINYQEFEVLPPDPHNFDGNKDGVACEG